MEFYHLGVDGGGYPGAGIGRWWCWTVGGAMHFNGAGGFSGGGAERNPLAGVNGNGGGQDKEQQQEQDRYNGSGGGGYYTSGRGECASNIDSSIYGGMSGEPCHATNDTAWYKDVCGSGGASGSGGEVYYTISENIFAFNGDMVTDGDYASVIYEYEENGTQDTSKILKVYERKDLDGSIKQFIPSKIFAQSGVIRATYTTNQGEYTLDKVKRQLSNDEKLPDIAKSRSEVVVVKATNKISNNPTTGYTNPLTPELPNQGIGSGAGYLEASNGKFEANPILN